MYNEFQFTRDFILAYPSHSSHTKKKHIAMAYAYYMHGFMQGKEGEGLMLGLIAHLKDAVKKYGSVLDDPADNKSKHNKKGKIFTTTRNGVWQIFYNDAFVLGGIHAHAPAVLVGLNKFENGFMEKVIEKGQTTGFDNALQLDFGIDKYGLRVTQREILGLINFGYKRGNVGDNTGFKCVNTKIADNASLYEYERLISGIVSAMGEDFNCSDNAKAKAY